MSHSRATAPNASDDTLGTVQVHPSESAIVDLGVDPALAENAQHLNLNTCKIRAISQLSFVMDGVYIGLHYFLIDLIELTISLDKPMESGAIASRIAYGISAFVIVICIMCLLADVILACTLSSIHLRGRVVLKAWIYLVEIFLAVLFIQLAFLVHGIVVHKNDKYKKIPKYEEYVKLWRLSIAIASTGFVFFLLRIYFCFAVISFKKGLPAIPDENADGGLPQADELVLPQYEFSSNVYRGGFYRLSTASAPRHSVAGPPRQSVTESPRESVTRPRRPSVKRPSRQSASRQRRVTYPET